MMKPELITHLSDVIKKYDAFLFDIYGVIHDGQELKANALDVITNLAAAGKLVFFLSNAPQLSHHVMEDLKRLGIDESKYRGVLTAGDQTYFYLKTRPNPSHRQLGKVYYFIGSADMMDIVPSNDYRPTKDITRADFIVAAGPEVPSLTVDYYEAILRQAAARSLPMICSNPDLQVFRNGLQEMRAGQLAAMYQHLGGTVYFHGKPHKPTYDMACAILKDFKKERMLIIGDSIFTDIKGANRASIECLLTVSMTTCFEIGHKCESIVETDLITRLHKLGNTLYLPTYVANPLKW